MRHFYLHVVFHVAFSFRPPSVSSLAIENPLNAVLISLSSSLYVVRVFTRMNIVCHSTIRPQSAGKWLNVWLTGQSHDPKPVTHTSVCSDFWLKVFILQNKHLNQFNLSAEHTAVTPPNMNCSYS